MNLIPLMESIARFRKLRRLFRLKDALLLGTRGPGLCAACLRFNRSRIFFRKGTSDLECLEQVFLNQDYAIPYPVGDGVIVDGGSNIGAATLYFKRQYPRSRIIAIEPDASNFELLQKNCGGLENVELLEAALWPVTTRLSFENAQAEKYAMSVVPARTGKVAGVSIADIMGQFEIDRISLLKLDIEGAEREVFSLGATGWLDRVDILAVELHDRFRPGCAQALYSALQGRTFVQEIKGDTIFISLGTPQ